VQGRDWGEVVIDGASWLYSRSTLTSEWREKPWKVSSKVLVLTLVYIEPSV